MKCDNAFGCDLDRFAPELHFRMDRSMYQELFGLGMKSTHWWMMTDLFADDSVAEIRPVQRKTAVRDYDFTYPRWVYIAYLFRQLYHVTIICHTISGC
jgi:hypothetical protein